MSRRFSVYEGRRLDAQEWNAARERHIEEVFAGASVPLAVLGCTHMFTGDDSNGSIEALEQSKVTLKSQPSIAQSGMVVARWLSPGVLDSSKWLRGPDAARQAQVLEWLYERLLDQLAGALVALPAALPLTVRLSVVADALEIDAAVLWETCWRSRQPRVGSVLVEVASPHLMTVDAWLDSNEESLRKQATLLVTIQLNPILSQDPPAGSAEAGAAVLFVPLAIAESYSQKPVAFIHRPMSGTLDELDQTLAYALRWGTSDAVSVARVWLNGIAPDAVARLHRALSSAGLTGERNESVREIDMDQTVGRAGAADPWLSLTCAALSAKRSGAKQLLIEQRAEKIVAAIVAPASPAKISQPGART
ncbi:hypothetical protein [Paraburkholderia sp. DHOC27]|uniref:hypothetical protein n=1 Tax=Paraburkholderia sp. DHOC27 TaxID=2303330 RepID=UPI0011C1C219|nr:hypothetical protein [Paraburkholderia sp. DHOC27]